MNNKKKFTINDIAKEAGVSRSLVSSVLTNMQHGKKIYRVSEETTQKIQEIMNRHNYHPNYSARVLRSGNNRTIGVILSDISNRFFSVVSRNIVNCAQQQGYMVMFGNTDENHTNLAETIDLFYSKGVQGFIVVPCIGSEETISHYKSQGVPIVLLDRDFKDSGLSSVTLDNREAAVKLTGKLLDEGYKKIELVSYDTTLGNIALFDQIGFWKKEPFTADTLKESSTKGTFAGETAVSFWLSAEDGADSLCSILGVDLLYKPSQQRLQESLDTMLAQSGLTRDDIDAIVLNCNGDVENDTVSREVAEAILPNVQQLYYKHLFGDSFTMSAMGLYISAVCLHRREIPAHLIYRSGAGNKRPRTFLLHNHYQNKDHSFMLLSV